MTVDRTQGWLGQALVCAGLAFVTQPIGAQAAEVSYKLMHSFAGATVDGAAPFSPLIVGSDGKLHGTSRGSGLHAKGNAFRMTPSGKLTVLHSFLDKYGFQWPDGQVQGHDGDYYGVTSGGGKSDAGGIYWMSPHGRVTQLHSFTNPCFGPNRLVGGADGNFYGTAMVGGSGTTYGCAYRITGHGRFTVLHSFSREEGQWPTRFGLVQASDGDFYGTAFLGGEFEVGTVFRMTADGTLTVVYSFNGDNLAGYPPRSGVVEGRDGQFYGVTANGGVHDAGTVYRVSTQGEVTVLHAFANDGVDGYSAGGNLLQARDGNMYGVTWGGGAYDSGTVFRITPDGVYSQIYSFDPAALGATRPEEGLVEVDDGEFYGPASAGGEHGFGAIYRIRVK